MSSSLDRLKVLVLAPGCDGTDVGESWSNYQWVRRLSVEHHVTLLTYRKQSRASATEQLPHARVIEWPDLPVVNRWDRFNSMLKPGYIRFYFRARQWIKQSLHEGESFDVVHQLSPLAMRYPSPAARFDLPLVVGPWGGSLLPPPSFVGEVRRRPWYTRLRALDSWRLQHDPWLRGTVGAADLILGVAPYVRDLLHPLPVRRFEVMSETGVESLPASDCTAFAPGCLRLLFVGRVIRTKGVRDIIRAMAKLGDLPEITLDVIGDGDDLAACRTEAEQGGISGQVRFHGRKQRRDVESFYAHAHAFVFPSWQEPSGNVVLEAMSHGLAMIVADRGGPGHVVDNACGLRVATNSPDQYVNDLANAIRYLAQRPSLVRQMGAASRQKIVRDYLWESKIRRLSMFYSEIVGNAGDAARDVRIAKHDFRCEEHAVSNRDK